MSVIEASSRRTAFKEKIEEIKVFKLRRGPRKTHTKFIIDTYLK